MTTLRADAANDISRRLIEAQSGLMRQTLLWAHYCRALREQGVPVDRGFLTLRQLHPQIAARSYYWDSVSGGAVEAERGYDVIAGDAYRLSPMRIVFEEQESVHCRCDVPDEELAFPILNDLKAQGFADYLAKPLLLSGRRVQAFTLASKAKEGFSADHIALIDATTPTFAAVTELNQQRLTARSLLSIYVGQRTGERVWAGEIRRGQGDLLHAVMLFCDLRGFTELAASQPLQATIDALNAYYEAIGGAVEAAGGEILKFIGDALLAIFPAERTTEGIAASGQKALAAVREGLKRLDQTNSARQESALPALRVGVALHVGEALYGNIGTQTRLDFTVIGTAVNTAARLGSLAGSLNEQLVISEELAPHLATPLRSLGRHELKGLPQPIEAFAV